MTELEQRSAEEFGKVAEQYEQAVKKYVEWLNLTIILACSLILCIHSVVSWCSGYNSGSAEHRVRSHWIGGCRLGRKRTMRLGKFDESTAGRVP